MSSVRPAVISISDMNWLDKSEAMAYTHRNTEEIFDRDFSSIGVRYLSGKGFLYEKKALDSVIRKSKQPWIVKQKQML